MTAEIIVRILFVEKEHFSSDFIDAFFATTNKKFFFYNSPSVLCVRTKILLCCCCCVLLAVNFVDILENENEKRIDKKRGDWNVRNSLTHTIRSRKAPLSVKNVIIFVEFWWDTESIVDCKVGCTEMHIIRRDLHRRFFD